MGGRGTTPFERYQSGGRQLLGKPPLGDGTCRRGYGPSVFAECGTACAYCGRELGEAYDSWLDLSIDHVIPGQTVTGLAWPREWVDDLANLVTCCRACNEFLNGYKVVDAPPKTVDDFLVLRDQHFVAKRAWVIERHVRERDWYDGWARLRRPAAPTSHR